MRIYFIFPICVIFLKSFGNDDSLAHNSVVDIQKLDPTLVLKEANQAIKNLEFDKSNEKFKWYWTNSAKIKPSLIGVKLTFALRDWMSLAAKYPPALSEIKKLQSDLLLVMSNNYPQLLEFAEFSALSGALGFDEDVCRIFESLVNKNEIGARPYFRIASKHLILCKRYKICNPFIGVDAFRRIKANFSNSKIIDEGTNSPQNEIKLYNYLSEVATMVALLIHNDRKNESNEIANETARLFESTKFSKILEDAKIGIFPPE